MQIDKSFSNSLVFSRVCGRFAKLMASVQIAFALLASVLVSGALESADTNSRYYNRFRYVSRVMYDGTAFRGWQDQEGSKLRTVQGILTKTLSKRFDCKVSATGASRTDHGVHARGQVIHFDLPDVCRDLEHLEFSLNRMLPDDLRLFNISTVPGGTPEQIALGEPFHATKTATGKLYVYRFCTNGFVDPMRRRYCAHFYQPMDIKLFEKCLKIFEGTHDFKAFANGVERLSKEYEEKNSEFTTTRTIHAVNLIRDLQDPGYYAIEFRLESALYRMVRNIVGSALLVAQGGVGIDFPLLQELLYRGGERLSNKSKPAPPEGLTLEHVYYDHY